MKIEEFTTEERQFLLGNISQLTVNIGNPEAEKIAALGRSVIKKLETSLRLDNKPADKQE